VPWSGSQARCGRSVFLCWARAEERRGLKREYRFYTILEVLQCGGGSNMAQYMPFQPVLEAFGGTLKIVGTGASTANQHMPHFADDRKARRGYRTLLIIFPGSSSSSAIHSKQLSSRSPYSHYLVKSVPVISTVDITGPTGNVDCNHISGRPVELILR